MATISSEPLDGKIIHHNGKDLKTVKEGLAHILIPANALTELDPKASRTAPDNDGAKPQSVFYNPIQQFNRDLSVLAIRAYSDDVTAVRRAKPKSSQRRKQKARQSERQTIQVHQESDSITTGGAADNVLKRKAPEDVDAATAAEQPKKAKHEMSTEAGSKEQVEDAIAAASKEAEMPQHQSKPRFKILDALSATGLRALRYAQEIPAATSITAVDLSADATASIKMNSEYNKLDDKIDVITGNAIGHMYEHATQERSGAANRSGKYDVIDLDPYGTAVPFLDAALQALGDGGLLCVTCTDAGVWASCGYPEKTYALYGGNPIRGYHSHEGGLRLILHSIATTAARYGIAIEPLLSLSIDFYARVFVRVRRSPADVKFLAGKTMLVYSCDHGCGAWKIQPIGRNDTFKAKNGSKATKHGLAQGPSCSPYCEHCGFKTHISGPMYGGPLHNANFIETILDYLPTIDKTTYNTVDRIEGMLSTALEETQLQDMQDDESDASNIAKTKQRPVPPNDPMEVDRHPFCFFPSALAGILHCQAPSDAAIKGALKHAGYKVTRSHTKPSSIKTNAPWSFLWQVMREWTRQKHPIKEGSLKPGTAGWGITHGHAEASNGTTDVAVLKSGYSEAEAPSKPDIVFDEKLGREVSKKRLVRYQTNPRANWGPMNRARG